MRDSECSSYRNRTVIRATLHKSVLRYFGVSVFRGGNKRGAPSGSSKQELREGGIFLSAAGEFRG